MLKMMMSYLNSSIVSQIVILFSIFFSYFQFSNALLFVGTYMYMTVFVESQITENNLSHSTDQSSQSTIMFRTRCKSTVVMI